MPPYGNDQCDKNMKNIYTTILILIVMIFIGKMFIVGMKKQEVVDCNTWKKQATEFSGFYLLGWQDEQCRANGIVIDTTVIKN